MTTKTTFAFTEAKIRDWPLPESGRVRLKDTGLPGLQCYVTPTGRTLYYRSKVDGRSTEIRLGAWPTLSIEEARKKAKPISVDPAKAAADKRTRREAETLGESWTALLDNPMRKDGRGLLRPGTLEGYKAAWERLNHWSSRRHEEITAREVRNLRDAVHKAHGPSNACQTLALLGVLLGRKMPREDNGRAIGKPTPEPRRRYLTASELGAILRGLDAEPPLWRVFWLCAILVPLRRGNIAGARWADVHLDASPRWEVSATNAKGRKLLSPPIPEALAPILRDWQAKNPGQEYVSPLA